MSRTQILPPGMVDTLPLMADARENLLIKLTKIIALFGYNRVTPPLIEYGKNNNAEENHFRLLDPETGKSVELREDMTLQVQRIAEQRLENHARPLRLYYGGTVLRAKRHDGGLEREITQIGAELIGNKSPEADAEIITIIDDCFKSIGMECYFDLCAPGAVFSYIKKHIEDKKHKPVQEAIFSKNCASLEKLLKDCDRKVAKNLLNLIENYGEAKKAMPIFLASDIMKDHPKDIKHLEKLFAILSKTLKKESRIKFDGGDIGGFSYQSIPAFSVFVPKIQQEVGRGGRYQINKEAATGFSIFPDLFLKLACENYKKLLPEQTIFLELEQMHYAYDLRKKGYRVINALSEKDTFKDEGRKLESIPLSKTHLKEIGKN